MSYLVSLVVDGRAALVVGGGAVAARKVAALVEAKARVTVVASQVCEAIAELQQGGRVRVERRSYVPGDARGAFVVVAATDDEEVNSRVAKDAHAAGALVNVVDRPALCTFTVPAVVHRGDLTIAVATGGRCPSLARAIRERLERQYGPEYAEALARLAEVRQRLMEDGRTPSQVQAALSALLDGGLVEAIATGDRARTASLLAGPFREADGVIDGRRK